MGSLLRSVQGQPKFTKPLGVGGLIPRMVTIVECQFHKEATEGRVNFPLFSASPLKRQLQNLLLDG